ncbi:MAG: TonB-dependent receptor [Prevotellaceae bacterium]|jgi:outer membrane receptor protein involved in Fe transport|nr:TonB-dependent receptor [Prevotellaceae bacterium]
MKRYIFIIICLLPFLAQAQEIDSTIMLDEVVISSKEGQELRKIPTSLSIVSAKQIERNMIENIRGLSACIPNLFIPDYGSKYTSAIYIRGVGARLGNSAIGMYVDNVPYLDKTSFDFDFFDISRIEVLRGPQGTLYGRNSMGGLVNVYTLSPREWQGTRAGISSGSHGLLQAKVSHYMKVSDKFALSVGGKYSAIGGFRQNSNPNLADGNSKMLASNIFPSAYGKDDVGAMQSAAARLNLDWRPSEKLTLNYIGSYEYASQNGYAYGKYNTTTNLPDTINYNDPIFYSRNVFNNSLRFEYTSSKFKLASTTGFQALNDSLLLDNDFAPESMFTLFQGQKMHSLNEEITIRSVNAKSFQWIGGVSAFYQKMQTNSKVTFKEDGIAFILQSIKNAGMPFDMTIPNETIPVTGDYSTRNQGLAAFTQLSHNLGIDGLLLSAGIRADYENVAIDYINRSIFDYTVKMPGRPIVASVKSDSLDGNARMDFIQMLPKFAVRYEQDGKSIFASVSKGYKTGGYNIQMFSSLMETKMQNIRGVDIDAESATAFKPEYSWNYEMGGRLSLCDNRFNAGLTLFYLDIRDQQIAEFAPNGQGRMIKNAGQSESMGVEFDATLRPFNNFTLAFNYGFTRNTFVRYFEYTRTETIDYAGKYVPYIPKHTLSLTADYSLIFQNALLDGLTFGAQYSGAGRIYWNEANDVSQKYYSLLSARIVAERGAFALGVWGKNLTGTEYTTFYFKTFGKPFGQLGKPIHFGVDLSLKF